MSRNGPDCRGQSEIETINTSNSNEEHNTDNIAITTRNMSPIPAVHELHDHDHHPIHDTTTDDVQMISTRDRFYDHDRKSRLIRQAQSHSQPFEGVTAVQVQNSNALHVIMSPTATMASTSPSAGSDAASTRTPTPMVLLKRQYSNNSNSSGSEEVVMTHQYQQPLGVSLTARRGSAFTPYTNLYQAAHVMPYNYHYNRRDSAGFSGHTSSSMSSPMSTSSRHSITPPMDPTPTSTPTPTVTPTPTSINNINCSSEEAMAMAAPAMVSLKWSGYEDEVVDTLSSLYQNEEWTDVTLSCEGHTIKAHKAILAMCSPFFRKMFQESPCKHPHVIVNGMKRREFERVIHFIYNGKVFIHPDQLDEFLDAAETLKIDGVGGKRSGAPESGSEPEHHKSGQQHQQKRTDNRIDNDNDEEGDGEGEEDESSMYTHHLLRHRHRHGSLRSSRSSHSDEYEHSLPAPFERLHLGVGLEEDDHDRDSDREQRPLVIVDNRESDRDQHRDHHVHDKHFDRDERTTVEDSIAGATTTNDEGVSTAEKKEHPMTDDSDNDRDRQSQYPLNRLPKFHYKHRRHVGTGAGAGTTTSADEGSATTGAGVRERRSTSSSISSGDTVVSRKTMLEQAMELGGSESAVKRPGSGSGGSGSDAAAARFELISPARTPETEPNTDDGDEDIPRSKSLRLDDGAEDEDRASPVDMSLGSRGGILCARPPPPPWYSPPSQKSCHSSDDEEHGGTSSERTSSGLQSPHSPSYRYRPAGVDTLGSGTSRASHQMQRHSLSHIYGGKVGGGSSFAGDESFMRRALSLSPPENQSYQLHLPEPPRADKEEYEYGHGSSSSRRNLISTTAGPQTHHLDDRRWMVLPPGAAIGGQRFSQTAAQIAGAPLQPSFQFRGFGSSAYPGTTTATTAGSSSLMPKSPLYASRSETVHEGQPHTHTHGMSNYAAAFLGANANAYKYRFKVTNNSSFDSMTHSQLRMQLAGINHSHSGSGGMDSLGNSTRASSASSSTSIGGGSGHQSQSSSSGNASSSALGNSHSHRPCSGSGGSMNHNHSSHSHSSLSSLTKPRTKAIRSCQVPQEFRYTAQEVDSMVERVENYPGPLVPCAVCAKFVKRERLRAHIHECHLLQGEKIICQYCGIALKSKGSYRVHIWRHKRGNLPTKKFKPMSASGAGAVARRPSGAS